MSQTPVPPTVAFGRFLVDQRRKIEKKASTVALEIGLLPSNYSKVETGVAKPPQDKEKLVQICKSIGLQIDEEWNHFYELAGRALDAVPVDLVEFLGREKMGAVFLRTLRDKNLSQAEFDELVEKLRH
jgi:hypothetical protein